MAGKGRKTSKEPVPVARKPTQGESTWWIQSEPHRQQSHGAVGTVKRPEIFKTGDSRVGGGPHGISRSLAPDESLRKNRRCGTYFLEAGGVQLSLVNDLHSYLHVRHKTQDSLSGQERPKTRLSLLLYISTSFYPNPVNTSICPDFTAS